MAKNFTQSIRILGFEVETTHCSAWTYYKVTKNNTEIFLARYSKHGETFVSFGIGDSEPMTDEQAIEYLKSIEN